MTWLIAALCATALGTQPRSIPITGDRLSGFVLPIEPLDAEIRIEALRAHAWKVNDTQRLALDRDVRIDIGGRLYQSTAAVVWLNRIPSAGGLINQLAVYFDDLENPAEFGSGSGISGREILITASTRGTVRLDVSLLTREGPRKRGLHEAAIASFQEAARCEPDNPGWLYRAAGVQAQMSRWQEVVATLEPLTERTPHFADAFYELGLAHSMLGRRQQARAALQRAAELRPGDPRVTEALRRLRVVQPPTRALHGPGPRK